MADVVVRIEDILGLTDKGGGGAVSLAALGKALTSGAVIVSALPAPLNLLGATMGILGISITAYTTVTKVLSAITALQPQLEMIVKMVGAVFNPAQIPALAGDIAGKVAKIATGVAEGAIDDALQSLLKTPLFKLRSGQSLENLSIDFALPELPDFDEFELSVPNSVPAIEIPTGEDAPYLDELIAGP